MPRLRVTSETLCTPGIFCTWFSGSLPLRYSDTVISVVSPETSENPPSGLTASRGPLRFTRKLKAGYGVTRLGSAIAQSPPSVARVGGLLTDTEDDELGG